MKSWTSLIFRDLNAVAKKTFIESVRKKTRPLHDRLEEVLGLERIVESRESYVEILRNFHGVWNPLEDLLGSSSLLFESELKLSSRMRAGRILNDLTALETGPGPIAEASLPWSKLSRTQGTGILYVLEGSTLGGTLISKRLKDDLNIDPTNGGSFFSGHGSRNRELWREFLDWAEQEISDENEIAAAADTAAKTFELIVDWFGATTAR